MTRKIFYRQLYQHRPSQLSRIGNNSKEDVGTCQRERQQRHELYGPEIMNINTTQKSTYIFKVNIFVECNVINCLTRKSLLIFLFHGDN